MTLRQALVRSVAEECGGPRAVPFSATSFEAFRLGGRTHLLDPLEAGSLEDALAETTSRWAWDRGDRLGIRELGDRSDRLHIYAVRKKSEGVRVWRGHEQSVEHRRWLDHICTIDLNAVAGIAVGIVGSEVDLHERGQRKRPERARLSRAGQ